MAGIYPDLLILNQLYLSKREFRAAFLRHRKNFQGRILDIGCGIKPFQRFLGGSEYIGIEVKADKKPGVCASAEYLPFHDKSFDTVLCTEVLEHVPEPTQVLSECYRVMKPGGALYITVPMTWYLHYEPHDYYRFTKYGIRYLCEKAGFDVVALERFGGFTMYLCLRISEFLHKILYKYIFSPLKICGSRNKDIRKKLATIVLIPYQLVALVVISLFDRFSPLDARGWVVLAVKRTSGPNDKKYLTIS
jgi:SAM-dependent methyltransferase